MFGCGIQTKPPISVVSANLAQVWEAGFHSSGLSCVFDGKLVIPVEADVLCLDIDTGEPVWKYSSPSDKAWTGVWTTWTGKEILAGFQCSYGQLTVTLDQNGEEIGKVETFDYTTVPKGSNGQYWIIHSTKLVGKTSSFDIEQSIPWVEFNGGLIFTITINGEAKTYDVFGKLVWSYKLNSTASSFKEFPWGLVVCCEDEIVAIDLNGKGLWTLDLKATSIPALLGEDFIIGCEKMIYKISKSGKVKADASLDEMPVCIESASNGFAVILQNKITTFDSSFKKLNTMDVFEQTNQILFWNDSIITTGYAQKCFKPLKQQVNPH